MGIEKVAQDDREPIKTVVIEGNPPQPSHVAGMRFTDEFLKEVSDLVLSNMKEIVELIDMSDIASYLDHQEISEHIDLQNIADNFDMYEIAECIDTSEISESVGENICPSDIAEYVCSSDIAEYTEIDYEMLLEKLFDTSICDNGKKGVGELMNQCFGEGTSEFLEEKSQVTSLDAAAITKHANRMLAEFFSNASESMKKYIGDETNE